MVSDSSVIATISYIPITPQTFICRVTGMRHTAYEWLQLCVLRKSQTMYLQNLTHHHLASKLLQFLILVNIFTLFWFVLMCALPHAQVTFLRYCQPLFGEQVSHWSSLVHLTVSTSPILGFKECGFFFFNLRFWEQSWVLRFLHSWGARNLLIELSTQAKQAQNWDLD